MKTRQSSSKKTRKTAGQVTIGIDIGDQWSHYCTLSDAGEVIGSLQIATRQSKLQRHFESDKSRSRVPN